MSGWASFSRLKDLDLERADLLSNLWESASRSPPDPVAHRSLLAPASFRANPINWGFSRLYHDTNKFLMMNTVSSAPSVHIGPMTDPGIEEFNPAVLKIQMDLGGSQVATVIDRK